MKKVLFNKKTLFYLKNNIKIIQNFILSKK